MPAATSPTALTERGGPIPFADPALGKDLLADVIAWARAEHFAPGQGDVAIYRHTDADAVGLCGGR